jgi:hypothetical protein
MACVSWGVAANVSAAKVSLAEPSGRNHSKLTARASTLHGVRFGKSAKLQSVRPTSRTFKHSVTCELPSYVTVSYACRVQAQF